MLLYWKICSFLFFLCFLLLCNFVFGGECLYLQGKHGGGGKKRAQTDTFEAPTLSVSKGGFEVGEDRLQWSDLALWLRMKRNSFPMFNSV